jgi:DNA-binding transcriptional LysR family regulator
MAPDHPLASRALIGLNECLDYPLIFSDESMTSRPYLEDAFASAMINAEPLLETNSIEVMRHSAMLDQAITFLTPFDIEWERRAGRLIYVPVRELRGRVQTLVLIGRDRGVDSLTSPLSKRLKAAMAEAIRAA